MISYLDRPETNPVAVKVQSEMRKAFDGGRAKAAQNDWSADRCESAIRTAQAKVDEAQAEYERLMAK